MTRRLRRSVVSAPGVAAVLLLAGGGCFVPNLDDSGAASGSSGSGTDGISSCVSTFPAGTTLRLRLGEVYDLTSDYLYEEDFLRYGGGSNCGSLDNFATGGTVTVTLQTELSAAQVSTSGFACVPYAQFDPPSLQGNSELPAIALTDVSGVTIAAAFSETMVDGAPGYSIVDVLTPARNPNAILTAAQLPPLVVSRALVMSDYSLRCTDTWVATLEPAP